MLFRVFSCWSYAYIGRNTLSDDLLIDKMCAESDASARQEPEN